MIFITWWAAPFRMFRPTFVQCSEGLKNTSDAKQRAHNQIDDAANWGYEPKIRCNLLGVLLSSFCPTFQSRL